MAKPRRSAAEASLSGEVRSLPEMFQRRVEASGKEKAWCVRSGDKWVWHDWRDVHHEAGRLATTMMELGLGPGERVCVMGPPGPHWHFGELAIQLAGGVSLGASLDFTVEQLTRLLFASGTRFALAMGWAEVECLARMKRNLPELECVLVWDPRFLEDVIPQFPWLHALEDKQVKKPSYSDIEKRVASVDPDSTAMLILTRPTPGPLCAAELSHTAALASLRGWSEAAPWHHGDLAVSYMTPTFWVQRLYGIYAHIDAGVATGFCSSPSTVVKDLLELKPTTLLTVPRLLDRLEADWRKRARTGSGGPQKLTAAVEESLELQRLALDDDGAPAARRAKAEWAQATIFRGLRDAFGGKLEHVIVVGAMASRPVRRSLWAGRLPVYHAWGMVEAGGITHLHAPPVDCPLDLGDALPGVEQRLAEDDELLVRGPGGISGYLGDAGMFSRKVDSDGFARSDEIAEFEWLEPPAPQADAVDTEADEEPVAEPAGEQAAEPAADPAGEQAAEPAADPAEEQAGEPAGEPAGEQAGGVEEAVDDRSAELHAQEQTALDAPAESDQDPAALLGDMQAETAALEAAAMEEEAEREAVARASAPPVDEDEDAYVAGPSGGPSRPPTISQRSPASGQQPDLIRLLRPKGTRLTTSSGTTVWVDEVEKILAATDEVVGRVYVSGHGQPHLVGLVEMEPRAAVDFAVEYEMIHEGDAKRVIEAIEKTKHMRHPMVDVVVEMVVDTLELRQRITAALQRGSQKLTRFEQVRRVHVLKGELLGEEDTRSGLTAEHRQEIEEKHQKPLSRLYGDRHFGLDLFASTR